MKAIQRLARRSRPAPRWRSRLRRGGDPGVCALAVCLGVLVCSVGLALAAPRSHPIALGALPSSPILPGDLLTLSGKSRFTHGQLKALAFSVGPHAAEALAVDNDHVTVVVPPFVPEGLQKLTVVGKRGSVEFSEAIPIGAIHVSAAGEGDAFRFGLNFADTETFAAGTAVSGWLQTTNVKTGATSPASVAGKITGNVGGILSLSLTSDSGGTIGKLSLASLDLATGEFFGSIFEPVITVQVTGTATVAVKPTFPVGTPPVITSVSPNPAPHGDVITIDGKGFGPGQGLSAVTWNGKPVVDVLHVTSWSDTRIVARLAPFDLGTAPLVVTVGHIPSVPVDLVVLPRCPPVSEFARRFGGTREDVFQAVQQTRDCGFVAAGRTASLGAGGLDVYLVKTDGNGGVQWTRTFGGKGDDEAFAVQQTTDGGYIVAGRTASTEAPFNAAGSDFLLLKVTSTGALEWLTTHGGKLDEIAHAVHETVDGGYALAGWTQSFGVFKEEAEPPSRNILLIKTDGVGTREWGRVYGGAGVDEARALGQTRDAGYVLAGFTTSFGGGTKAFVVKADSFGEQAWTRTYGTSGDDAFHSVRELSDAGYALGGRTRVKGGDLNFFFVKTDAEGATQLSRTYGGAGHDEAFAATFAADGGYALAGQTASADLGATGLDGMLVKTDCQGRQQFRRLLAVGKGDEAAFAMQQTHDGGFVLAGFARDPGAASDALLARFRPFDRVLPEIVAFTANGVAFREIEPPTSVELFWRVTNAAQIHVERLSGPGPDLDSVSAGGADVSAELALAFTMDPRSCLDGCADTVYRLTATSGCDAVEAHVSVRTVITEQSRALIDIENVLTQRFQGGLPSLTDGYVQSHPRVIPFVDLMNTCFRGQGKPFASPLATGIHGVDVPVDGRSPDLVLFDQGNELTGWAYARIYDESQKPTGFPAPDSAWFVHEGGWHLGDGAMTGWPIRNPPIPPPQPYFPLCGFPCVAPVFVAIPCPGFDPGCGPFLPPFIPHPTLWDLHVFRDTVANGAPKIARLATEAIVNGVPLPDPCGGDPAAYGTTSRNTPTPMELFPLE